MVANCRFDPPDVYDRKLDDEIDYWLPVIAGIATKEEVDKMTAEQLGIANAAAQMKVKLLKGGIN